MSQNRKELTRHNATAVFNIYICQMQVSKEKKAPFYNVHPLNLSI